MRLFVGAQLADPPKISRRLILLLDGTWNDDSDEQCQTNIVSMRELLRRGLEEHYHRLENTLPRTRLDEVDFTYMAERKKYHGASGFVCNGFEYLVYYDEGVGTTGVADRVRGGLAGTGLALKVRQAYRFLARNFRPGDEIMIFGFSRGAFTARSLCGYLHAVGLLREEACTAENERRAWVYYHADTNNRMSGEWMYFNKPVGCPSKALVYDPATVRVRVLGVFDTVGAMGIPKVTSLINRIRYRFHDTSVNPIVDIRLHALAIDEARRTFEATIWSKSKFQVFDGGNNPTEQVWFPGAHADIGGGYGLSAGSSGLLSHISLAWMIARTNHFLKTTVSNASPEERIKDTEEIRGEFSPHPAVPFPIYGGHLTFRYNTRLYDSTQHDPWGWARKFRNPACRVINQNKPRDIRGIKVKGMIANAEPIAEMVHVSALLRLRQKVTVKVAGIGSDRTKMITYEPPNLCAALPFIAKTYGVALTDEWAGSIRKAPLPRDLLVVGWDGHPMRPDDEKACALVRALLEPLTQT
jgi:uncharacterized protein (DUF2235 family)